MQNLHINVTSNSKLIANLKMGKKIRLLSTTKESLLEIISTLQYSVVPIVGHCFGILDVFYFQIKIYFQDQT